MLHSVAIRSGNSKGPASKGPLVCQELSQQFKGGMLQRFQTTASPPQKDPEASHWCELHAWRSFSLSRQLHGAPGGHDNGSVLSDMCLFTAVSRTWKRTRLNVADSACPGQEQTYNELSIEAHADADIPLWGGAWHICSLHRQDTGFRQSLLKKRKEKKTDTWISAFHRNPCMWGV